MNNEKWAVVKSWARVFAAAVIASFVTLVASSGTVALDGEAAMAILVSGIVAVGPVILNWLNKDDPRYGKGFEPKPEGGGDE